MHVACKWGKLQMVKLLIENGGKIDIVTRDGLTPLHCAARSGHDQVVDLLLQNNASIMSKTKNGLAPLHMAAQGEHVDAARILLYYKSPVDDVTIDYLTALHVAAHCGHVRVAKLLLERSANPNARALNGFTPLHIACKKNRIKVVELLLKHDATIGATTESGLTPLHVASFMGCIQIVMYLIQNNANLNIATIRGETPLHLAVRAKQTNIIRILLRNGANTDAKAREEQTPLHVASRLGNGDIITLLLQNGANVDALTKDNNYTPLHIAIKEGQYEIVELLLNENADIMKQTSKGFTTLHLAAKYGYYNIVQLLLKHPNAKDLINQQGKNGVTPLHVTCHYNHYEIVKLLLQNNADVNLQAKNGHTPLHIVSKKNFYNIAEMLILLPQSISGVDEKELQITNINAESKSGFTPLHLSIQENNREISELLINNGAKINCTSKNGLQPMHLCAQEDNTTIAQLLLNNEERLVAENESSILNAQTKSGFTPLHIASHFGHLNIVKFLLEQNADIECQTINGYTPLHQATQQGHTLIINILLKHNANPNAITNMNHTSLQIANKLGYVTIVEILKTITTITTTTTVSTSFQNGSVEDENPLTVAVNDDNNVKLKVIVPEIMQETYLTDTDDDCDDLQQPDHQYYKYMTTDDHNTVEEQVNEKQHLQQMNQMSNYANDFSFMMNSTLVSGSHDEGTDDAADNIEIVRKPVNLGFLVSFLVDARGGSMTGCRHSGRLRIIVPPTSAQQPTRITCRYIKLKRIQHPPPLMEGEALASRIIELGPAGAKFMGPAVILEIPYFTSQRNNERELIILRSDLGDTWKEHTNNICDDIIIDSKTDSSDDGNEQIIKIATNDFPHYFAIISRIKQEVHTIGPDGGTVSSQIVPQVQAIFPPNALTKKIRVGLQAQSCDIHLTSKLLGHGVAVSPIVTVEPRRRKFHKAITLNIPIPRAHSQSMINQYTAGNTPTLRLLCSITGGQNRAVWEDVTGSTPLTFINNTISFTTTVSARFWLMDCRNIVDATRMATELYTQMSFVPFLAKFIIYAKRVDQYESILSIYCITDDRDDQKTLEQQENYIEIAKSTDIEMQEGRTIYLEFIGSSGNSCTNNIIPVSLKTDEQYSITFNAFQDNRLSFKVRTTSSNSNSNTDYDETEEDDNANCCCIKFMLEPKIKGVSGSAENIKQKPLCKLNFKLPDLSLTNQKSVQQLKIQKPLVQLQRQLNNNDEIDLHSNNGDSFHDDEKTTTSVNDTNNNHNDDNNVANLGDNDDNDNTVTNIRKYVTENNADGDEEVIHKADIKITDICNLLNEDWALLANELNISFDDIELIKYEYPNDIKQQSIVMLRLWLRQNGHMATGNVLEQALYRIKRGDIVQLCITNMKLVTDVFEKKAATKQLQSMSSSEQTNLDDESKAGESGSSAATTNNKTPPPTPNVEKEDGEDEDENIQICNNNHVNIQSDVQIIVCDESGDDITNKPVKKIVVTDNDDQKETYINEQKK